MGPRTSLGTLDPLMMLSLNSGEGERGEEKRKAAERSLLQTGSPGSWGWCSPNPERGDEVRRPWATKHSDLAQNLQLSGPHPTVWSPPLGRFTQRAGGLSLALGCQFQSWRKPFGKNWFKKVRDAKKSGNSSSFQNGKRKVLGSEDVLWAFYLPREHSASALWDSALRAPAFTPSLELLDLGENKGKVFPALAPGPTHCAALPAVNIWVGPPLPL